ncbi:transposase [Pararoseomonas baculiformis]|uniref:transposase n=1 Tax=Pararoseomonas baculiformis TaxID=2820812 RepID=UPI001ADFDFB6
MLEAHRIGLAAGASLPRDFGRGAIRALQFLAMRRLHGTAARARNINALRSRGGRPSKLHCLTDDRGRPLAFADARYVADIAMALPLLQAVARSRRLLADKAYDAEGLRLWLKDRPRQREHEDEVQPRHGEEPG